nr:dead-box atp-dependent rna helicase 22 [Quercus suber]
MLLNRSASLLYLHRLSPPPTKFFSHFKHSYSLLLSNPSPSAPPPLLPSCPSFSLPRVSFFCLNPPRQRQARPFATTTAVAAERKETDTFFTDEDVSWASLGVSDKLSRALYSAGIDRPSLVQVPTHTHPSLVHSFVEL